MSESLLRKQDIPNLSVHLVWSSQLGATESHVARAMKLMEDPRVIHYWDQGALVGTAFQGHIENLGSPAWDVWALFAAGVTWEGETPPEWDWWEHQLSALDLPELRLDPPRFASKALELSKQSESR